MAQSKSFKSRLKPIRTKGNANSSPKKRKREPGSAKSAIIIEMVTRPSGAMITELMAATGWQAHSVRAALTKARMTGLEIASNKNENGSRRYFASRRANALQPQES